MLKPLFHFFGLDVRRRRDPLSEDVWLALRGLVGSAEPILFDVGANVGQTARQLRRVFPRGRVWSFEPFPESYERLCAAVAGDEWVEPHRLALSDTGAGARMHVNRNAQTNSLLPTDARAGAYWGSGALATESEIEVPTATLDGFCAERGLERIDVLKLDVQGGEYGVLLGGAGLLARRAVGLIYMELITAPTYVGQRALSDYLQLLSAYGYEIYNLYNLVHREGRLIQADILFRCAEHSSG